MAKPDQKGQDEKYVVLYPNPDGSYVSLRVI